MNRAFREDGWRVKARWVLAFAMPLWSIYYWRRQGVCDAIERRVAERRP
jgi:hypothetical protein